jgi:hypothetical protein
MGIELSQQRGTTTNNVALVFIHKRNVVDRHRPLFVTMQGLAVLNSAACAANLDKNANSVVKARLLVAAIFAFDLAANVLAESFALQCSLGIVNLPLRFGNLREQHFATADQLLHVAVQPCKLGLQLVYTARGVWCMIHLLAPLLCSLSLGPVLRAVLRKTPEPPGCCRGARGVLGVTRRQPRLTNENTVAIQLPN